MSYLSPKHKDIEWYYPNGTENSLSGNVISQFCEDPDGNIWIATKGDGIILAEKEGHILSLLDSNMMKMIFIA